MLNIIVLGLLTILVIALLIVWYEIKTKRYRKSTLDFVSVKDNSTNKFRVENVVAITFWFNEIHVVRETSALSSYSRKEKLVINRKYFVGYV